MKKMKSIICCFFAICIFFTMVACGSKTPSNENTEAPSGTNATPETGATATPEVVLDLQGRTIRYAAWWSLGPPTKGSSEAGDAFADKVEAMETKYNFKFEYPNLSWNDFYEQLPASVLASDPFTEVNILDIGYFYPNFVGKKLFYPVSDLENFDFTENKWDKALNEITVYKGKQYGLNTGHATNPIYFAFNKRLVDNTGIDIYNLYNNKQWTWDKFLEVVTKTTVSKEGTIEQYGFASMGVEIPFVYSNNGKTFAFDENGNGQLLLDDPNTMQAFEFLTDLRVKHNVWLESENNKSQWGDTGSTAFKEGTLGVYAGPAWSIPDSSDMSDDYGVVTCPIGPQGTDYIIMSGSTNITTMLNGIKNPEDVAFIWNIYTNPIPGFEEIDMSWYETKSSDDEGLKVYYDVAAGNLLNVWDRFSQISGVFDIIRYDMLWRMKSGEITPKAAMDEYLPQAKQKLLDLETEANTEAE